MRRRTSPTGYRLAGGCRLSGDTRAGRLSELTGVAATTRCTVPGCPGATIEETDVALWRVKYESDEQLFRIEGGAELSLARDGALVMPRDAVSDVGVAYLAKALRRCDEYYGEAPEGIYVSEATVESFDPDRASRDVWLTYEQHALAVEAGFGFDPDDPPRSLEVGQLVAPVLARHRAKLVGSWTDYDHESFFITASLGPGASVGMLVELGIELQQLLVAAENGAELTARTALHLTKAARVGVILGQPEGIWLDAKREPYPTATELQRWEIAKDVAAFANAGIDALILIGVATKATVNGDVLDSTHPFPIAKMDPVAIRAIVRDRVTPDIQHLDVGVVESRGGYGYGWIFVPAPPQEVLPFIVAGALLGGDVRGSHMSIPTRSVEDTTYSDPSAVHSLLAAGRAVLRRAPG